MGSSTTNVDYWATVTCCDNPSKWGLQQLTYEHTGYVKVVITPQNGVFNNKGELRENKKEVVISPSKWGLQQHIVYKSLIIIYLCQFFYNIF